MPVNVKVKICGITSLLDARAAVEAGADALGFIFYPKSPRHISIEAAAEIIRELPPFVSRVGVFVNSPPGEIELAHSRGINVAQLHGDETSEFARALLLPVIKAARVKDRPSIEVLRGFPASTYLLDSYTPGQQGGTGEKFNWDLAIEARSLAKPIILAGGLTPENVADAVAKVAPYAVDVSSGVESSPGVKDHQKIKNFIARAKGLPST